MNVRPRFDIEYPVFVRRLWRNQIHPGMPTAIIPDGTLLKGTSRNLSLSGVGVVLSEPAEVVPGAEYSLRINFGDPRDSRYTITLMAKAVWISEEQCGFQITEISEDSRRIYYDLVESHAGLLKLDPDTRRAA